MKLTWKHWFQKKIMTTNHSFLFEFSHSKGNNMPNNTAKTLHNVRTHPTSGKFVRPLQQHWEIWSLALRFVLPYLEIMSKSGIYTFSSFWRHTFTLNGIHVGFPSVTPMWGCNLGPSWPYKLLWCFHSEKHISRISMYCCLAIVCH